VAEDERTRRLHITPRSIVLAVALLGLTIALLAMIAASARVIGWILVAATFAALLHPIVRALDRRLPHALALALVVVVVLATAGFIGYRVVDDVNTQLHELQRALPKAARSIEHSQRFGEVAREAHLARRVSEFVVQLPERLRGGDVQDALRAAATRGVAFLATTVLTIFFLIHGPRLLGAAAKQLPPARERRARQVAAAVYVRSWRYIAGSIGMAMIAGLLAYGCSYALDLPGAAPLSLWMALVDVIPVVGVVLGALPLVLLSCATSPWWQSSIVAFVLIGWQVVETTMLQARVERRSLHLGPFITIAVAMVGLELYGIGGALVSLVLAVALGALADEVVDAAPEVASAR
jgi:predicted PurR-regulated permease PerM